MGSKFYNDINYQVVKMSYKRNCLGLSYIFHDLEQQKKMLRKDAEFSEEVYRVLKQKGVR